MTNKNVIKTAVILLILILVFIISVRIWLYFYPSTENVFDEMFYDATRRLLHSFYTEVDAMKVDQDYGMAWGDSVDGLCCFIRYDLEENDRNQEDNQLYAVFQSMGIDDYHDYMNITIYADAKYIEFNHEYSWGVGNTLMCVYTYDVENKTIIYHIETDDLQLDIDTSTLPRDDFLYQVIVPDWIESTGSHKKAVYPETEE